MRRLPTIRRLRGRRSVAMVVAVSSDLRHLIQVHAEQHAGQKRGEVKQNVHDSVLQASELPATTVIPNITLGGKPRLTASSRALIPARRRTRLCDSSCGLDVRLLDRRRARGGRGFRGARRAGLSRCEEGWGFRGASSQRPAPRGGAPQIRCIKVLQRLARCLAWGVTAQPLPLP